MKKISVKKARLEDIKFLFETFNKSVIEKFTKTKRKVSYADHKVWFLKCINSKSIIIYILYFNNHKVGYIRINIFRLESCFVSIYLKKQIRLKNLGSIYLNRVLKASKNKFNIKSAYAEVKKKNELSKFFFLKNEFKLIKYSKKFKSIFDKNNYIFKKNL